MSLTPTVTRRRSTAAAGRTATAAEARRIVPDLATGPIAAETGDVGRDLERQFPLGPSPAGVYEIGVHVENGRCEGTDQQRVHFAARSAPGLRIDAVSIGGRPATSPNEQVFVVGCAAGRPEVRPTEVSVRISTR
jgi:hypothetical protein